MPHPAEPGRGEASALSLSGIAPGEHLVTSRDQRHDRLVRRGTPDTFGLSLGDAVVGGFRHAGTQPGGGSFGARTRAAEGSFDAAGVVTGEYRIDVVDSAYQALAHGEITGRAVIVRGWADPAFRSVNRPTLLPTT
ncbi:hypothetical protein AB1K54_07460 [Microbacterium sp. BWT-B31]|uniref:hypothetical protein n=1 Tax=Microbacterium sp. BWT-B31 TaxID=3232072 RepID=UPI003527AA6B